MVDNDRTPKMIRLWENKNYNHLRYWPKADKQLGTQCSGARFISDRPHRVREAAMYKLSAIVSAAILVWFISTPSPAMPINAQAVMSTDQSIENARLVCDEFGRCWQSQPAPYASRYPYSGLGYGYRPLTKWERKGFCPPGQRKKGNC
jgi:hypothetical protein